MGALLSQPGQLVVLGGRLDVSTAAAVRAVLHDAVGSGDGDLLVDVSAVRMLDATGLGVLVGTHHRAERAGRRLVLVEVPPRLVRLLLRTRLHRVLHVQFASAAVG